MGNVPSIDDLYATDPEWIFHALTAKGAAEFLGTTEAALSIWRGRGGGPKFAKIGSKVRYQVRDLIEFIEAHKVGSTAEANEREKKRAFEKNRMLEKKKIFERRWRAAANGGGHE